MRNRFVLLLALAAAAAAAVHATALAASPRVSGPTTMSILQKVTFKATGLRAGRYAVFIAKDVERSGRTYRCVAFLSAPRPVTSSTERFFGSVPDGVVCRRGGSPDVRRSIPFGSYRAFACRPTPRAYCSSRASQAAMSVRIVRRRG